MKIKNSQKRILKLIQLLETPNRYMCYIAKKLEMDYSYCKQMLDQLEHNGLVTFNKVRRKKYILLTPETPSIEELSKNDNREV